MNICESITITSKLFPDRTALVFEDQQVSYRELNSASALAALVLRDAGVQSGDRVALMLPNAPCFPIWYYAALRIGGIAVSISTRLSASEVEFVASDCEPKVFIANEDAISVIGNPNPQSVSKCLGVDEFSGLPNGLKEWDNANDFQPDQWWDANPEDPALILYTSGTTGFPKGATLSHGNVRSNVHAFNHLCNMRPDDSVLLAVPLFHCFGQNALLNSVLNVGGKLVLQSRFDLNYSKDLIQQHAVNQLYGVPMMFGLLHESCSVEELGTVDYCFSAAATLPNQIEDAWFDKFGIPIHQGYGLTETSPFATYNHRLKFRSGSIGTPIDSVEIKVVDVETGHRCNVGQLGEIAIKGPNVMLGYWNRPDETEQAIRDGWFYSGDIGRLDEDGYLFIVDRVKDMITVGGLKVFPAEVERVLLDSPIIRQVAVIGVPDSVFGEQVIAYVVLTEDAPDSAITLVEQYAKQFLGNYKLPRRIVLVEELPRNASGKILKTKLREMAADNLSQSDSGAESETPSNLKPPTLRNQVENSYESEKKGVVSRFLCEAVAEVCDLDQLPQESDSFIEAGLDSLAMVSLTSQLQVEVGMHHKLPPTLLFDYPRISDMTDYLVALLQPKPNQSFNNRVSQAKPGSNLPTQTTNQTLRSAVQALSEEDALAELMKELE